MKRTNTAGVNKENNFYLKILRNKNSNKNTLYDKIKNENNENNKINEKKKK